MENNEYSKFRNLNYEKDYDFEEFWEANKYTKDIFENSGLYAQNFKNFNDVDECVYLANQFIKEELIEEIYIAKKNQVICCFSSRSALEKTYGEELMWAHYANGSKGMRIDFTIDKEFEDTYVKKVEYKPKKQFNNGAQLEEELNNNKLENIMCRKSKDWEYEQEYRAIFHKNGILREDGKQSKPSIFPIKIEKIIFGRGCGFFPDDELKNFDEEQKNAKSHVIKIASFIYEVLKESNKYVDMPKFYYHKDKYSLELDEIKENELLFGLLIEMKRRHNKSQDKIQKLKQKIIHLKKEIVNLKKMRR